MPEPTREVLDMKENELRLFHCSDHPVIYYGLEHMLSMFQSRHHEPEPHLLVGGLRKKKQKIAESIFKWPIICREYVRGAIAGEVIKKLKGEGSYHHRACCTGNRADGWFAMALLSQPLFFSCDELGVVALPIMLIPFVLRRWK